MGLTIEALAKKSGLAVIVRGRAGKVEIDRAHASDRMSDLLGHVSDSTLLITNLVAPSVVRIVELMDIPAICLLNNAVPAPALVEAAKEHRTALLVSPSGMFETCGKLYKALEECETASSAL